MATWSWNNSKVHWFSNTSFKRSDLLLNLLFKGRAPPAPPPTTLTLSDAYPSEDCFVTVTLISCAFILLNHCFVFSSDSCAFLNTLMNKTYGTQFKNLRAEGGCVGCAECYLIPVINDKHNWVSKTGWCFGKGAYKTHTQKRPRFGKCSFVFPNLCACVTPAVHVHPPPHVRCFGYI